MLKLSAVRITPCVNLRVVLLTGPWSLGSPVSVLARHSTRLQSFTPH
jgi:hypothetical protein